jgi:aspartyl-tRNA(Asn)/glutamyl-tRNA(Gln) amidotransferase subunit A
MRGSLRNRRRNHPQIRERLVQLASAVTQQGYVQAPRECELLRRGISDVFRDVDLVTPTMASPPPTTEPVEKSASLDPSRTRNTWPFDVSGLPAISIPCGFTAAGLPIDLQIGRGPFQESTVLALAHRY